MPQPISLDQVPGLLRPGQTVFVQGGSAEPTALLATIRRHQAASEGVHYLGVFPPGINRCDPSAFAAGARLTAFFATPELRESVEHRRTRLLPLPYSSIFAYLHHGIAIDLALIQVAPPDAHGECSLGVSVDFVPAVLDHARVVVAEINRSMPRPPGSPTIPLARIDHLVEVDHPLVEGSEGAIDPVSRRLGDLVATLVRDGDTIQVGIGKIPTAVLGALGNKNDLGFHSGLMAEPVLPLIESGVITGANKPIDRGLAVTGIAFGSGGFYRALAQRPDVLFRPADYTHDGEVLRALDRLVAINSAIEVDLLGQINAEFVNGRPVSGVGGLADFMRGARLARNGRSIIALPARAGAQGISRIVPRLAAVTCARSEVDLVVTEFGVATLRDKDVEERAEALIAIAAPEFRDDLALAWRDRTAA